MRQLREAMTNFIAAFSGPTTTKSSTKEVVDLEAEDSERMVEDQRTQGTTEAEVYGVPCVAELTDLGASRVWRPPDLSSGGASSLTPGKPSSDEGKYPRGCRLGMDPSVEGVGRYTWLPK